MLKNSDFLFKQITEKIANTDFTGYTVQYPPLFAWRDAILDKEIFTGWEKLIDEKPKYLGIYIHLPFCKQRCYFCRYFSIELQKQAEIDVYLSGLKKEIRIYRNTFCNTPIRSIYFGGGTPSLLNTRQLDNLFSRLYKNFNLAQCKQISFEGNPDFLDSKKLKLLKQWGVNRLTIGVQSLDPKVISAVNRYQSANSFLKCFKSAKQAKIENINVDLMVGLPLQTMNSVIKTLVSVIRLQPEMIHVHPFYPTRLSDFIRRGQSLSRQDMLLREKMSLVSLEIIKQSGYMSIKFDADGKNEMARNIQLSDAIEYNSPFLGLGGGALSHATGYFRYVNKNSVNDYLSVLNNGKLPVLSLGRLSKKDEMIYFVTASLRYGKVNNSKFKEIFKEDISKVFKNEIAYLIKRTKIKCSNGYLYSNMANIGEYQVFSKYFYDKKLIANTQKMFGYNPGPEIIKSEEMKFMLL